MLKAVEASAFYRWLGLDVIQITPGYHHDVILGLEPASSVRGKRVEEVFMPNRKNSGAEFDPMGVAPAMMQCWRVAMFDMPMACALEMNACMTRLIGHQQTFMRSLVQFAQSG